MGYQRPCAWENCQAVVPDSGIYCQEHSLAAAERRKVVAKLHYQEHKDEVRERVQAWKAEHPDLLCEYERRAKERREFLTRQPCWLCGWHYTRCHRHRIIPGSQGGKYRKDNILVGCPNCHALAHDNPDAFFVEMARGLLRGMPIHEHWSDISTALDHFSRTAPECM